jgi:hypothetical protein
LEPSCKGKGRGATRFLKLNSGARNWRSLSFRRAGGRQGNRLDPGQVELAGSVVDVEPDDIALGVEIDDEAFDNLPRLDPWCALQLDIKTVCLRI